jgi:hypothetical protein
VTGLAAISEHAVGCVARGHFLPGSRHAPAPKGTILHNLVHHCFASERRRHWASLFYIAAQVTPAAVTAGDWSAQLLVTKTANNVQIALGTSDFSGAAVVRNQLPKINEAAN